MSEKKPVEETKAAKPATAEAQNGKVEGKAKAVKEKRIKQKWSLQRCQKAARRFHTEAEWRQGAPSSYKSATAHGWVPECLTSMKQRWKQQERKTA